MTSTASWDRYQQHLCVVDSLSLSLDVSKLRFTDAWLASMQPSLTKAFDQMAALEGGAIANPDEHRQVGHYWLRAPELGPPEAGQAIRAALAQVKAFTASVHDGSLKPEAAQRFTQVLLIGIGGSALGPQLAADALGSTHDRMAIHFFDNTDPDGFDRVLARLAPKLTETLVVVISKSGGTKETRNGMLEAKAAFERAGLLFHRHAVAVTGAGSELDKAAQGWLARFPMWDWVGGRTSELSAVGLLPAALQGLDIDGLLEGARLADVATRERDLKKNPAALMALMWHHATRGRGEKDLVVLPYKDRLLLMSRYLQQLVMESNGKIVTRDGAAVDYSTSPIIFGAAGTTGQHSFYQMLHQGTAAIPADIIVQADAGAWLTANALAQAKAFMEGKNNAALPPHRRFAGQRASTVILLPTLSPATLGALIAFYEHKTFVEGVLWRINSFDQWGVELGKVLANDMHAALQGKTEGLDDISTALFAKLSTIAR